jgi:hypothetical protein
MRWEEHVVCMGAIKCKQKLGLESECNRPFGRPRSGWKIILKMILKE